MKPSDTLDKIEELWGADLDSNKMPIGIRNVGRNNLPELLHELGFTSGAEIGVERGLYSEVLLSKNPGSHLLCVDPWTVFPNMREGYQDYPQSKIDKIYAEALERLKPYPHTIIRKFSADAVKDVPLESLDYVYIDGNHEFSHVAHDLTEWSKRVKSGGIISGHDYKWMRNQCFSHVVETTNAYTLAYQIKPWFTLGTQNVVPGEIRDGVRSFMWVKP